MSLLPTCSNELGEIWKGGDDTFCSSLGNGIGLDERGRGGEGPWRQPLFVPTANSFRSCLIIKGRGRPTTLRGEGGTLPTLPPRSLSLPGTWRRRRPRGARWGICHDLKRKGGGGKQKKEGRRQRLKARNKMEWEAREVF